MKPSETVSQHGLQSSTGALAVAIQESLRWQDWIKARDAAEVDQKLTSLFARYRELSNRWQQAKETGGELPGKDMLEIAKVQSDIMAHPRYVEREDAARDMRELLQEVNILISKDLGINFAQVAAPRAGGCCG